MEGGSWIVRCGCKGRANGMVEVRECQQLRMKIKSALLVQGPSIVPDVGDNDENKNAVII